MLLVEDEEHKANDLLRRLQDVGYASSEITVASSVREAVLAVGSSAFELLILDMALPTFTKGPGSKSGGVAQSVGGVEVLRALSSINASCNIIIVTQYPEITMNGKKIKLKEISATVGTKYNQNIKGVVLYSIDSPKWGKEFDRLVRGLRCAS